jgi:hypothetical protein
MNSSVPKSESDIDGRGRSTNNCASVRFLGALGRIVVAAAVGPWLVLSSLVPAHVHAADAADHQGAVAHRHFSEHEHAGGGRIRHSGGAEVEDPDEQVVWLDDLAVAVAAYALLQRLFVVKTVVDVAPRRSVCALTFIDESTLPHGPPCASVVERGPPLPFPSV